MESRTTARVFGLLDTSAGLVWVFCNTCGRTRDEPVEPDGAWLVFSFCLVRLGMMSRDVDAAFEKSTSKDTDTSLSDDLPEVVAICSSVEMRGGTCVLSTSGNVYGPVVGVECCLGG